ncbi:hypothetical protein [Acinetobacter sp.]|uniref:hypothetical protein n=1 Tax=Acinetobacter sp. TaxID=472 RepID=UPI00388E830B
MGHDTSEMMCTKCSQCRCVCPPKKEDVSHEKSNVEAIKVKTFFRFMRPVQFCYQRHCIEATPAGGICFFVTPIETEEKVINVSFSICDGKSLFNRAIAKQLAALQPSHRITVTKVTANEIADSYLKVYQLDDLSRMVEKIRLSKKRADLQAKLHKDAIEALKLRQRYYALNTS